ncbi:MAG: hypothetical protein IH984_06885 [Planctomycetes bacterium]|nr:hypothetical protein [Planctomycetota bacterium]
MNCKKALAVFYHRVLASIAIAMVLLTTNSVQGQGACCLFDDCVQVNSEAECSSLGGVYLPRENCDDGACGVGACCFETNCNMADAFSCITSGREFAGAGTTCLDDPCDSGIGACCFGEDCLDLAPEECAAKGGTWLGAGTNCSTEPCNIGACCIGDDCFILTQLECQAMQGKFLAGGDCIGGCIPLPECPDNILFGQQRDGPEDFFAGTSELGSGFARYENFTNAAGMVETVRWWGLDLIYLGGGKWAECAESDPTFEVSFHEDAGGQPGDLVCTYTLLAQRTPLGIFYLGTELNLYEVQLPESCFLLNGWIKIVGMGDPDCWFLWISAGVGESFCEGCQGQNESYDLAICLAGQVGGVFGACCDEETLFCSDNVEVTDCVSPTQRFVANQACKELDPPCGEILGACCLDDATCQFITEEDCATAKGSWLGANTACNQCPCVVLCPPDSTTEGEPTCQDNYNDLFNGGCAAEKVHFSPIDLGETICGETGIFFNGQDNVPDFDWYQVEVPWAMQITWTIQSESIIGIWILDGNFGCPGEILSEAAATECFEFTIAADVQPGNYWLVVATVVFNDLSACGAKYVATAGPAPCIADLTGDGIVNTSDLLELFAQWGTAGTADLDGSGAVDTTDLLILFANWGPCI